MGVTDVDKKLGGGLPLETITLVEGDPESGKSVVVEQLAFNALRAGLRVVAFLSETKPRQFLDQMQSLGMPSMDYYLIRRLALYPANLRVDQDRAERIMRKLLRFIETSDSADVVIFDSVTPLLFQFDARYVLSFLATCKELAALGKSIIVTLHSYAINESLRLRADSIVDAHLRLRIEELGKQVVRTLEVAKIRGAVKTVSNSVSFTVEPGIGLKTVPISKTKA
jgi:flagellar protein FlaH